MQRPPMTPSEFEDNVRRSLAVDKLRASLTDWLSVPDKELEQEYRRRNDKVKLAVVSFTADSVPVAGDRGGRRGRDATSTHTRTTSRFPRSARSATCWSTSTRCAPRSSCRRPTSKTRNKALPVLSVAGLSVALASAASAVPAGPATDMAGFTPGEGHQITFGEEEISDVTLATFYVFDKENVGGRPSPPLNLSATAMAAGVTGTAAAVAEVTAMAAEAAEVTATMVVAAGEAAEVTTTMAVAAAEAAATPGEAASESGSAAAAAVAAAVVAIGVGRTAYGSGVGTRP